MTWLLVLLASLLVFGSHPYVVQGEEQTAIGKTEDGSLHIVSENDVHINTTASVFVNGIDVVKRLAQHQKDIDLLMARLNASATGEAIITTTSTTTTTASCEWEDVKTYVQLANPSVTVNFDGHDIDMENQDLTAFSFGTVKCSIPGHIRLHYNLLASVDFGQIISVDGNIYLYDNDLTTVDFAQITSVGSNIRLNDNDLTTVDFGQITSVGGYIDLDSNNLTPIDFGQITSVGGYIDLDSNNLTSIDFGQITSVGGSIKLRDNKLTTVDFGQITSVGGYIDLDSNDLTSIDFGQIISVGENIYLYKNDLTTVDCTGVTISGCICVDAGVSLTNCPEKCTWSYCDT